MEKVLNQEEIDAMVRAARAGAPAPPGATAAPAKVTPWDARQAGHLGREQLRAINQLHEAFARNLTHSLGAYLRVVFEAAFVSAEHLTYSEFLQRLPEVTYLACFRLSPLSAVAVLQLDLSVALPIIDLLLGGQGTGGPSSREITEIEEQILESVGKIICRELQVAWIPLNLEFVFDQRQRATEVVRLMPPEEKTLSLNFEITMPEVRGSLSVAFPAVVSNALLRKLSRDWAYQKPRGPAGSAEQLRLRLGRCPLSTELDLTGIAMPLRQVVSLAPGQILRLPRRVGTPAVVRVAGHDMFAASPVRCAEHRAARILQCLPPRNADKKETP